MEFVRSSLEQVFIIPKAIFRLCFIIVNNAYCIPTYVVWMILLLPLRKINPETYWRIEGYFFHWLLAMVSMWSWSAGYDVVETGDDISECLDSRTLVLSNHQSTADVPMLMACFNARRHVLPNLMWIMDSLFKYTNFGIVSVLHQDFFIMSGKEKRAHSIQALASHLVTSYVPRNRKWMVLFPEGGFLRKRRVNSQLYAEKHQLPVLQHVTLPRVGAITAIMETLGPAADNSESVEGEGSFNVVGWRRSTISNSSRRLCDGEAVTAAAVVVGAATTATSADPLLSTPQPLQSSASVSSAAAASAAASAGVGEHAAAQLAFILDITIAYPDGPGAPLDLKAILFGHRPPCRTTLLYRLYRCTADNGVGVPKSDPELANWLFSRWQEKDRLLAAFYRNGRFPTWYKDVMQHSQHHHQQHQQQQQQQQSSQPSGGGAANGMEGDYMAGGGGSSTGATDLRECGSDCQLAGPLPMVPATLVSQDCLRFIVLHLFFITSTYVHVLMFLAAYEYATYFISY